MGGKMGKDAHALRPLFLYGASSQERLDVAQRIHAHSPCAKGAFVVAGLTAVPRALREERLFGTEGNGWIEQARGGTLLLDELDCLCPNLQRRFVEFVMKSAAGLRDGRVAKAGGREGANGQAVRVVVASRHDHSVLLCHGALEGELRQWLASLTADQCLGPDRLRAVRALSEDKAAGLAAMFEPAMRSYVHAGLEAGSCNLHESVIGAVEKPLITMVLHYTGGNQLKAAALLGLNRNTLRKRIRELEIIIPKMREN